MTDDPMPASFVWTGDDELQKEPDGPALGNYPAVEWRETKSGVMWPTDRRTTMGEKIARFLEDLAEKVRGVH